MNGIISHDHSFGLLLLAAIVCLSACSLPTRRPAAPQAWSEKAQVVGLPGIRYVVRTEMPEFAQDAMETFYRERAYLTRQNQADTLPPANFLALSGGGDNGAFGAGLLCGWTAGGTRPVFKGVTGISTGALIAPFAFLGPKYDSALREVYAQSAPKGILEARYFLAAIFEDALAILSGCASSDVTTRQPYTGERVARPDRIIVHDFAATSADVPAGSALAGRSAEHPTPQTAEQIETGRQLGAHVAKELVAEIRDMGLPAVRAAGRRPGNQGLFRLHRPGQRR
ncbi:patatin-like phospholipase family protein [Methylocaldum sp. GT1BB]|uniref:patatin-like phospholipase family protein n=1 Tax=Methylocaldum sp. GT1BB TaxID=3438963 RepID=UPI003DA0690F